MDDDETTYFYDGENRLIEVRPTEPRHGDLKLRFTYDYMGRRVRKVSYKWCDPQVPKW